MALDPKIKKDADEAKMLLQDTLLSVGARISESIRESIQDAVDGVDASVMDKLGKDLTRSFASLAKFSDDTANNGFRIDQGLLRSRDVTKQLITLQEKLASLDRKKDLAMHVMGKFNEEDYLAAKASIEQQQKALELDLDQVKQIEKKIGLTGKLAQSLNKIPGIGQFLKADEIEVAMRKVAAEGGGRFKTMGVAASMVGKQLVDGLTDPLFIIEEIFTTYLAINKASVEVQRLTGQNAVTAAGWNTSLASAKDFLETISELTAQTGRNAQNVFSKDVLSGAAELKVTMGLAADEAGGIAIMAQTSGKSVNNITKSVVATTSAFNKANRSAVSQGVVLRDVAKTSDSIKLSLANNPESLAKAASAAARLGMSLQDVDNIASSLLNFEESISNELEAELLIGKDLNLEKARELALSNDLKGLGDELFKNSADIHEFGKMNRIQQEAQAKALGMSRDQLAKVAYQRALDANMTEEQAAAAANVNAEDMKRISAQENFAKALEKIAGAVAPILDVIGNILSLPLVPHLIMGALLVGKIGGGLLGSATAMGSLAKGTLDFVKNLNMKGVTDFFGGLKDKFGAIKEAAGEGFAGKVQDKVKDAGGSITEKISDKVQDKVGDKISGVADKAAEANDKVKPGAGAGIKSFFTSLGQGFVSFAQAMAVPTPLGPVGLVMAVSLAAITASIIGLGYAFGIAAPGIEAFGKVVSAAFAGLAVVVTAIADGFVKLMGAVTMENIGPMLLLGPALFGIAAGLGALSIAGFMAIPAIAGLVTLAAVAPALTTLATAVSGATGGSVGESKTKAEEGSLAAVEAKLAELITVVKAGGTVYLDSNKVGRTQVLGSYKSA
jgi:hypothetical protein